MPVISKLRILELLEPFGLSLTAEHTGRLLAYLELLTKWSSKINLVGPATDEECVTRHFGESLLLGRWVDLKGKLLDIGSGAGFPGLALKIICPDLDVTLLEPIAKKRAFLKEVARVCQFDNVSVLGSRIEDVSGDLSELTFDFATSRAVGGFKELIENVALCLKPGGRLCLWVGHGQEEHIKGVSSRFRWAEPHPIPFSEKREVLIGELSL